MALPTVADVKTQLNMRTSNNEAELAGYLSAAISVVEDIVGPLRASTVTDEIHYSTNSAMIALRQAPVTTVTEVSARYYGPTWGAWAPADWTVDSESGVLRLAAGQWFRGDVKVSYTVGRSDIPDSVNLAILIITGHLWETQRGASNPSSRNADPSTAGGFGFAIPNRASELLAGYGKGPRVA